MFNVNKSTQVQKSPYRWINLSSFFFLFSSYSFRMPLSKEEHIEIILMAGSGRCHKFATEFNRKPGKHITHDTVAKLIEKFKKTENVAKQLRSGRPRTSAMKAQPMWCSQRLQGVPKEHMKVGCRKPCDQIKYHAHLEEAQMASIQNANVAAS
jgi:hypothetical protein